MTLLCITMKMTRLGMNIMSALAAVTPCVIDELVDEELNVVM